MCLSFIEKKFSPRSKSPDREGIGWKIFQKEGPSWGSIFGFMKRFLTKKDKGKWLRELDFRSAHEGPHIIFVTRLEKYEVGWHFYLTRKDAYARKMPSDVVKKIRFRRATAFGTQDYIPVGVAKEIMLV